MSRKERKRIALIVNTLSSGGAEHVAANLSRALSDRYDIDLILNDDKNITYPHAGSIVSLGMPADSDRMGARYQLSALIRRTALLRRLKRDRRYAASYSFSDNTNLSNVLSGSRFGRTVISVRYSLDGKERSEKRKAYFSRLNLSICCLLADTVVSCSKEIGDELHRKYLCRRGKLRAIYNGVDHEAIKRAPDDLRADKSGGGEERIPSIVSVGRLSVQKAQWHLLYALRELKDRGLTVHLTVLGEGSLRGELEKLCRELGIEEQVSMPGWVDDVHRYMNSADAAVITSDYEGFCNAILEAMAYGVPCISTDHRTGAREMLAPDTDYSIKVTDRADYAEYGVLVPVCQAGMKRSSGSSPAKEEIILADAIQRVLTDTELADKYREAGIRRTEELSLEASAAKWAEEAEKHSPRMIRNKKGYQAAGAAIGQLPDDNTEDNI